MSKMLERKLDLKDILMKIHNFEANIGNILRKLQIKRYYEDEAQVMNRWKREFINQVSDKIQVVPETMVLGSQLKVGGKTKKKPPDIDNVT